MVDAGMRGVPAFAEKSVSPRVSEIAMMPKRPLRMRPAIDVMSDMSELTVRGAVELTAGAAGARDARDARDAAFREGFFFEVPRLCAEVVVFFLVLVWDESGTAVIDARRTTASMRSLRYSMDFR